MRTDPCLAAGVPVRVIKKKSDHMILGDVDFTLVRYEKLCMAIKASKYDNITFRDYFERNAGSHGVILLRHDIDQNIRFALDMAKVEHDNGIKATYYLRLVKNVFIPDIIDKIASYGHEVGYHYETLDRCNGDIDLAIQRFSSELSMFRERFDVKTVCMHGNPLTKYDNRDIWKKCSLSDFGLLGEPYLSLDYNEFEYFSDSGRTWDINKFKIKDTINVKKTGTGIQDSNELIGIIERAYPKNLCILTHPERWPKNFSDYVTRYLIDQTVNVGKRILVAVG